MNEMTKFTHVFFLSVIKTEASLAELESVLGETFELVEKIDKQQDMVLVYRDILFSQEDMQKGGLQELEQKFIQRLFDKNGFPAECQATFIWQENTAPIPAKNKICNGRTVALMVYPELEYLAK